MKCGAINKENGCQSVRIHVIWEKLELNIILLNTFSFYNKNVILSWHTFESKKTIENDKITSEKFKLKNQNHSYNFISYITNKMSTPDFYQYNTYISLNRKYFDHNDVCWVFLKKILQLPWTQISDAQITKETSFQIQIKISIAFPRSKPQQGQ